MTLIKIADAWLACRCGAEDDTFAEEQLITKSIRFYIIHISAEGWDFFISAADSPQLKKNDTDALNKINKMRTDGSMCVWDPGRIIWIKRCSILSENKGCKWAVPDKLWERNDTDETVLKYTWDSAISHAALDLTDFMGC